MAETILDQPEYAVEDLVDSSIIWFGLDNSDDEVSGKVSLETLLDVVNAEVEIGNLVVEAADHLSVRSGTTAQTLSVAGTYTDASNYERLKFSYSAAAPTIPAFVVTADTAGTGADNIDLVLVPGGTGAIRARTTGNARGGNSIELQTYTVSDASVASGQYSVTIGALSASTDYGSVAVGYGGTAAAQYSVVIGGGNNSIVSGAITSCIAGGLAHLITADAPYASIVGGREASAYLRGQAVQNSGVFAATGDCQSSLLHAHNVTTDATQTELFLDGAAATLRAILPASKTWQFNIKILGVQTGGAAGTQFDGKAWEVTGVVRRNGANDTVLWDTINKTVINTEGGAGAWDVDVQADNTNEALVVKVTGEADKNVRWRAAITLNEIGQ